MKFESDTRKWRWLAFAATVVNIAFNFWSQRMPFGEGTVAQITQRYPSLFTPAGYAFAIWGLIYFTTLIYAFHQLLPSQRSARAHERLAKPLIAVNVLGMIWLLVFQNDLIALSLVVIAAMLVSSLVLFLRATASVQRHEISTWFMVPASLWFGWLSVASIANASLWLVALGWTDSMQVPWAFAEIGVAVLLGFLIGHRYHNWIYPLVIAWAAVAICLRRMSDVPIVALAALASAALMIAWAGYCAWRARRDRGRIRIFHGPLDAG